jgi:1A family penicillin-binding protein
MHRKGKYTQKPGPVMASKRFIKRRIKWWKGLSKKRKVLYTTGPVLAFLIVVPIVTYAYYYNDIGDTDRLLNRNNTGVVLADKNNKVFFSSGRAEKREQVPLKDIADVTEHALIAGEDKDFYEHSGFSPLSIVRAMYTNILARGIAGGGSTITQQLAKNTLLSKNQTILRKYQELTIATAIEHRYSKEEILTMYLNSVYYGEDAFGIDEAAKTYFNKKPSQLDLAESAMLIGVLPAPSAYSPISGDPELAKERQTTVLSRMVKNEYITEAEKTKALAQKLTYAEVKQGTDNSAPHFTEMVLDQLYEKYGEEKVKRSGYRVKTTLDLSLQKTANQSVRDNQANIESNGGSNASVVAIDPKTGGIRTLVGSIDYDNKKFGKVNMAITPRQPGSSFKPIYHSAALAQGVVTPATVLKDEKTDFGGGYSPDNFDFQFRGNITERQALGRSLNIPSVKVMQKLGVKEAVEAAKKLGITTLDESADYGLSLALGSAETKVTEMTNAYATFANGGERRDMHIIESINDKYDKPILTTDTKSERAISEQGAYLITDILSDNPNRAPTFGSTLNITGTDYQPKTVAVKTGTTDDAKDAWTIGYTPDIAIGVWVGNNDHKAMVSGGSTVAGPIWKETITAAIGSSTPEFRQPSGIVKRTVCTDIGPITDVFLASNVPNECEQKKEAEPEKKKEEKPKPETKEKCTVAGRENLSADDEKCVEEMCTIDDKEDLAANDPNCKEDEPVDSDGDGVADDIDQCPSSPPNATVDENGCEVVEEEPTDPTGGGGSSTRPRGQILTPVA